MLGVDIAQDDRRKDVGYDSFVLDLSLGPDFKGQSLPIAPNHRLGAIDASEERRLCGASIRIIEQR